MNNTKHKPELKRVLESTWSGRLPGWCYILVLSLLILEVRFLANSLSSVPYQSDYSSELKKDPIVGVKVVKSDIIDFSRYQFTYLIVIQPCGCKYEFLKPLIEKFDQSWQLVFITATGKDKIADLQKLMPDFAKVLSDENFIIGKELNACFMPRAYVFDSYGTLKWKQNDYKKSISDSYVRAHKQITTILKEDSK